jgi:hypothetical protein
MEARQAVAQLRGIPHRARLDPQGLAVEPPLHRRPHDDGDEGGWDELA